MTSGASGALALARRHPLAVDVVVALALAGAALVSLFLAFEDQRHFDSGFEAPGTAAVVVAMLAVTLPLAGRRRFPLATGVVVAAALVLGRAVLDVGEGAITVLAAYLAIYSAARHGQARWRPPAVATAVALLIGEVGRELFVATPRPAGSWRFSIFVLLYNVVIIVLPWWLGAVMRSRDGREQALVAQTAALQREREENARRAVFEERVRIARELHDVVAHHVSVMGVQAGAARRVMERRPEQAQQALAAIEEASRQAVVEMEHLLGFLRREGEVDELAPQPGLGQLDELVRQLDQAGLVAQVVVDGDIAALPRTVDVSAYRVVQEALTNTLKHAGATAAVVRVRCAPDGLDLEVVDDGRRPRSPGQTERGGGHGLMGMRERVGVHGGHLRAGPRAEGGFEVHAHFPLNGRRP